MVSIKLTPAVHKVDNTIHQINHYPMEKKLGNPLHCSPDPMDSIIHLEQSGPGI